MDIKQTKKKLTYNQRIDWFYANYYESGMEHDTIYHLFKNLNLDKLEWYGDIVEIPKYKEDIT